MKGSPILHNLYNAHNRVRIKTKFAIYVINIAYINQLKGHRILHNPYNACGFGGLKLHL